MNWAARVGLGTLRVRCCGRVHAQGRRASATGVARMGGGVGEGAAGSAAASVVYVTIGSREAAAELARGLVEGKLVACVNIVPGIESMYWWEGKVQTDHEVLLMCKTRTDMVKDVVAHVDAHHPYDLAECIAVPVTDGSARYIEWVRDSTQPPRNET